MTIPRITIATLAAVVALIGFILASSDSSNPEEDLKIGLGFLAAAGVAFIGLIVTAS